MGTEPELIGLHDVSKCSVPFEVSMTVSANFLSEDACREWVLRCLHTKGVYCPRCHVQMIDEKRLTRFFANQRIFCPSCQKFFTAVSQTFLSGTHLNFRQIVALASLVHLKVRPPEIVRIIGEDAWTVRGVGQKVQSLHRHHVSSLSNSSIRRNAR